MPRKRLRPTSDPSSDSDNAPEAFTLAESKKSAKRKSGEIEKAHAAINRQSKLKNQERDRVLKEQAKRRKERVNAEGDEDGRVGSLEARMERAMKEAQDEESVVVDSEGEHHDGELASDMDLDVQAEDEDMEFGEDGTDDDEEEEDLEKKSTKHLPDHLFEAAFASQNAQVEDASKSTTKSSSLKPKPSKKKKRKTQSKDIVLGSRTIRTLLSTSQISREGSYAPMRKTQKYIDRSLALKGGNSRVRGWQRKAANIGVMRHSGPAAKFSRS
ncbi:hypothetical protein F5887DRAFT_917124 [Amanita rubescens]|nr:hypothetical protein F5887DRAFT_917124 [Amanita rubescens]